MRTTHSYIEAHRFVTPRSTRTQTEPSREIIDNNLMNIINQRAPNRIQKLLKTKGISYEKKFEKEAKTRQEIFQRAYFKEKARILS